MTRPVTLFTGQWADMPLAKLAAKASAWGYDGLELACWGDHFDVARAAADPGYCADRRELLEAHGLEVWAISNHLVGQAVCDPIDDRHRAILPPRVWGDGDPEGVRARAAAEMKATARAAANLGVEVVNGFTGSSIWHLLYPFPPVSDATIDAGFADFASRWHPILDAFDEAGVRFALEVHPTEIAFDIASTERTLEAIDNRDAFGFNYDPSHLAYQGIDVVEFIHRFSDRIYHVHLKDVWWADRPMPSGVFGGHLPFGHRHRSWDFRSPGRGKVPFEDIVRALARIGYAGPLSVEWEDMDMDREHGAREACAFVRSLDFPPSSAAFDAAFERRETGAD
ncbi:MAG: sugar phosphate isomerase/epimerase [Gammaproteobacteria bacterium]|nr:sugar phosphate isomerase/epimerase [Gammaproteobacteria bacterium]MYF61153.1 sugar phosphate isomerase/epimerase [Gammaproteobacteria bacterium]MYI22687.1 sugar phosphate isomerase/epimerase [Gammaproteobacteria bacterium]